MRQLLPAAARLCVATLCMLTLPCSVASCLPALCGCFVPRATRRLKVIAGGPRAVRRCGRLDLSTRAESDASSHKHPGSCLSSLVLNMEEDAEYIQDLNYPNAPGDGVRASGVPMRDAAEAYPDPVDRADWGTMPKTIAKTEYFLTDGDVRFWPSSWCHELALLGCQLFAHACICKLARGHAFKASTRPATLGLCIANDLLFNFVQLEGVPHKTKANRYNPRGPPARIFKVSDLRRIAHEKWGGEKGFRAEAAKREERRKNRKPRATAATPAANKDTRQIPDIDRAQDSSRVGAAVLRPLLAERVRALHSTANHLSDATAAAPPGASGSHRSVLYWLNTAQRAHENPALEVAALEAQARGVPLRVVSVLLQEHRFMNARRMAFALEGLRDVQAALQKLGVRHEVRAGQVPTHLSESLLLYFDAPCGIAGFMGKLMF